MRFEVVNVTDHVDRNEMRPGKLYVEHGALVPILASFLCPCGRSECHPLRLPISPAHVTHPCWQLSIADGVPSITPSVRRNGACNVHFFLTNGQIQMC